MLLPIGDNLERPNFPAVTVALIFVNIAVFVVTSKMELTGNHLVDTGDRERVEKFQEVEEFYGTWGAVPVRIRQGEVMGLLTHMFLHASLLHLIGNLVILWVFGQSLETALGGFTFTVLYLFWGVAACLTQSAMDFSSELFLFGASGAIAGVLGGYTMLFGFTAKINMLLLVGFFPFRFSIPAIVFGVCWIMQQMFYASLDAHGTLSGVAWMAHVGGFLSGLVTLLVFRQQTDQVLISDGDRLYFEKRETTPPPPDQFDPDDPRHIDLDDESCFVDIRSRPCPACGTQIDKDQRIGDRLLRCPHSDCGQLAYLTDEELAPEYVE